MNQSHKDKPRGKKPTEPEVMPEQATVVSDISDDEMATVAETETEAERTASQYPFIPLKNVVVFPKVPIKLVIGARSLVALEESQQHFSSRIVVAAQKERQQPAEAPSENPPASNYLNELHKIGTLVEVTTVQRQSENSSTTEISVEGICRVHIDQFLPMTGQNSRVQMVEITPLVETNVVMMPTTHSLMRHAVEQYIQLAELNSRIAADSKERVAHISDPGWLADYIAAHLPKASTDKIVPEKQAVLEELDVVERLNRVNVTMASEIELLELDGRIRNKVRQQIDKNQREFFLREQLKAIHDELGGELGNESAEFRKRILDKQLAPDIEEKMLKEVNRLERMSSASPESNVVRTYLDWVLSLPWNDRTEDNLDVKHASEILEADHYGLDKVKERILEFLAVRSLTKMAERKSSGPILCLVGPPGVGKTSLGHSIARSMGRKFIRVSLGGVRDESEIRGHRRTYVGALPGRLIAALKQAGTKNPVILLDEIDKMSNDYRGDPAAALLEVLDPEQNSGFTDHYLDLPFDLSEVLFITTANSLYPISRPLLDRMEVIQIGGYTEDEKVQIARRYLLPKQVEAHALDPKFLSVSDTMIQRVIRGYTREAGVRNLERRLATICRKAARMFVEKKAKRVRLSENQLEDFLGVSRENDDKLPTSLVGVAYGLAVTDHGGEMLPVEVVTMPGRGGMTVTGRLGEVMQESAKAALSYAKSRSKDLHIDVAALDKLDLHVHLPEGAVPKDGPSAGITMATALISAITHRRVRNDTAMTGEITLRGRVLAIGGLKEKALAAHRAGIYRVIAPAQNRRDFRDMPKLLKRDITWVWVESMDEVVREILVADDLPIMQQQQPAEAVAAQPAAAIPHPVQPLGEPLPIPVPGIVEVPPGHPLPASPAEAEGE